MSSRSIGVMNVVFSRFTISCVTWSPACSTSLMRCVFARASLKSCTISWRSAAALVMCAACWSNRSKKRTSRGIRLNMRGLVSSVTQAFGWDHRSPAGPRLALHLREGHRVGDAHDRGEEILGAGEQGQDTGGHDEADDQQER